MFYRVFTTGVFALLFVSNSFGQQTINSSIMHGGINREFILYLPANYTGAEAFPLLFNFHGYTSNASQQMEYGDFRPIADTAGFIIVHPEGTEDNTGTTHFNVGWGTSTVDDVDFTRAMIETLPNSYNIDTTRIYSCGMSNGGFMSFKLACELSDRIAAIGSVTGSMTFGSTTTCNPTHPIPVIQIHGTSDGTVNYNGNGFSEPVPTVVDFWSNFNNCDLTANVENVPDINTGDGTTVEKFTYSNGDNCSEVVHYKISNGSHTWPGSAFPLPGTNYDINASLEIWKFVSQFDINGRIDCATTGINETTSSSLSVYPNPVQSEVNIEGLTDNSEFELVSVMGEHVLSGKVNEASNKIQVSNLSKGIYFLKIENEVFELVVE
jgi:polyhydroxybutyrate depolymerase